jgi:hypothetical protein
MRANIIPVIALALLAGCTETPDATRNQQPGIPGVGTSNIQIGISAVDARWTNYGVYLRRLTETVQIEWDRILGEAQISQSGGASVSVSFVLNSKGAVPRVLLVKALKGMDGRAIKACVDAITNPAPYGKWTDDMVQTLGSEQTMTFTFYYE